MSELYKAIAGSPITYLTGDISAGQTTIAVADDSALPDAPNICTIGYGENIETIRYGAKSNGVLQNVTRGIEGTPRAWPAGTEVARFFTAYDHNAIIAELEDARLSDVKEKTFDTLKERLEESEGEHQAHLADFETHLAESSSKHITESGSNANGHYIKFDDGTMICYGSISARLDISTAFGSLYRNDNDTLVINYAKQFISEPHTSFSSSGTVTGIIANQTAGTTSSQALYVLRPTSLTNSNVKVNYIAIGRWK